MNKYYTPTIEEFHVGFEYEMYEETGFTTRKYEWVKSTVTIPHVKQSLNWEFWKEEILKDKIRVKYLDKEDIESLGFILSEDDPNWFNYKDDRYYLYKEKSSDWKWIIGDEESEISFSGAIKNKSELKKLLSQLNIP